MVKVKWLGHSGFFIESEKNSILIDPFLTGNPKAVQKAEDISADFILITHGHGDHLGDSFEIAKKCGATIIAPNELALYAQQQGLKTHPMHIGGFAKFPFGSVKLTPAFHGSSVVDSDGNILYMGMPCGFLVGFEGKVIYHAGDTGLFGDMRLIGENRDIDLAMLPIGDNFTMGPKDAARAVDFLKPKIVVPMHYGTFPIITDDIAAFQPSGIEVKVMKPGEQWNVG